MPDETSDDTPDRTPDDPATSDATAPDANDVDAAGTETDPAEVERLRLEAERLRQENEALKAEVVAADGPSAPKHRGRWAAALVLIVIGSLLVPVSILGVWLDRTVTDTDRYVDTVAPLARDPEIQKAVAARLEAALFDKVDVQAEVQQLLPEQAAPLAGPIASALRSLASEIINRLVQSDQFAELWDKANEVAQKEVVDVLTNSSGRKGVVEIDLTNVAKEVSSRLEARGIPFASNLANADVTFDVFQSEEVAQVQQAFKLFDRLAGILPWVTIIILAAGILVAPNRRKGLLYAAIGWVLGCLLLLAAVAIGRSVYFGSLPTGASLPANEAFFDTISRFLRGGGRTMLAVGVVVLLGALIAGPSGPAVRLRATFSRLFGAAGDAAGEHGADLGPVGAFVSRNLTPLRITVGLIAVVWFLALNQPSAGNVLWIAVFVVVALAVLEVVARAAAAGPGAAATEVQSGGSAGTP